MNPIQIEPRVQNPATRKEAYKKPEVTTFGSVAQLTLGGNGTKMDGCSGKIGKSQGGPC